MRTKSIAQSLKSIIPVPAPDSPNTFVTSIEYQPGNGSRYKIILIDQTKAEEGCYTVALMTAGHGTCMNIMPNGSYVSAAYVGEKLKVSNADAVILAELIAHLTHRTAADASDPESYK